MSKARLSRLAIHYLYRLAGDDLTPEQRLFAFVINLALREIGSKYHDSSDYLRGDVFLRHCEVIGVNGIVFRDGLIKSGLLSSGESLAA